MNPTPEQVAAVRIALLEAGRTVTKAQLVGLTGMGERLVRAAVSAAVCAGAPIVTDREDGGYLWTLDTDRLEAEVALLGSHAAEILARKRALEKHLDQQRGLFT